jgi:hypothetical protein
MGVTPRPAAGRLPHRGHRSPALSGEASAEPTDGQNTAVMAGLAGLWALAMAAGTAWSLIHILRASPGDKVSVVALILLLVAALGAAALAGLAYRWRTRRRPATVIGALDNTTGALVAQPMFGLVVLGILLGQSVPWVDRIPETGIALFAGVMIFAWPALGVWLSLGRRPWQYGLGNIMGGIFLLAGWVVFAVLWIVALAGFAA